MPSTRDTIWTLAQHTAAKHSILRRYLEAWYPKLRQFGRLFFVDGFAGPGEYVGGEPGSPIIAITAAVNHRMDLSNCELRYAFIEMDRRRHAHLESVLQDLDSSGRIPNNISWETFHGEFAPWMEDALAYLGENRMAPALFMIDPTGVAGVPMDLVQRLGDHRMSEVLVSFMYQPIERFMSTPEFEPHLDALFGVPDWRSAASMPAAEKKPFLHDLYLEQLHEAGFNFVRSFEMKDDSNRTEYFLMFGTHSIEGLKAMKDAMWKVDPSGDFQFADATVTDQMTLFEEKPDFSPLETLLRTQYAGKTVSIEQIERFVLTQTPYRESHIKRQVLAPMERSGDLEVETERNRKFTYPARTLVKFPSEIAPRG